MDEDMNHETTSKKRPFTFNFTPEEIEAAIAAAAARDPALTYDPYNPYDPDNEAEVTEYWSDAVFTRPGEHPHQKGFKGFNKVTKTIAQKMFVKNYTAIAVINAEGHSQPIVAALPPEMIDTSGKPVDFVLMFAGSRQELEDVLPLAKPRLAPKGALWIAYVKGTSKNKSDVHRDTIREYAETVGLTTVSLIAVDEDWSALRLKHSE